MGTITSLMMTPPPRHQTWVMIPLPRLQTALWIGQSTPAGDAWLGPASIPSSVEIVSRKHQVRHVGDGWWCLTMLWMKSHQTLLTCPHSCPLHLPALHRGPRRPTLQLQAVHPGQPRPGLVWRPTHHTSPCCFCQTRTRRWREWVWSTHSGTWTTQCWVWWIWILHIKAHDETEFFY